MAKQLVLRNPPDDVMKAIAAQQNDKAARTTRKVGMTEAVFDLIRLGEKYKSEKTT